MSTNTSTKNPQLILEEISKRLNRISGGTRLFSLHEAIKLAKEDQSKLFESLTLIKTNLGKFGQPTAATANIVTEIIEIIDTFAGNLSLEEIDALNLGKTINAKETEETVEEGFKHVITEEDLKNNPELVGLVGVGDEIFVPGEEIEVTAEFLELHPELVGEVSIGDKLMVESDTFDYESDDTEETEDFSADFSAALATSPDVKNEEETKSLKLESTDTKEETPNDPDQSSVDAAKESTDGSETEEKLEVKASITFEGTRTKVTKKLLTTHKILEGSVKVGDFIYINGSNVTAIAETGNGTDEPSLNILTVPISLL